MARPPYRIARQEHLGDMLDALEAYGHLAWRWEYDVSRSRAIFHVRVGGEGWCALDTRAAEALVQAQCDLLGIRWRPVPHPGGELQRSDVVAWIHAGQNR